jgi:hypothetical protein
LRECDNLTLADYGIQPYSLLNLYPKVRGGMFHNESEKLNKMSINIQQIGLKFDKQILGVKYTDENKLNKCFLLNIPLVVEKDTDLNE